MSPNLGFVGPGIIVVVVVDDIVKQFQQFQNGSVGTSFQTMVSSSKVEKEIMMNLGS